VWPFRQKIQAVNRETDEWSQPPPGALEEAKKYPNGWVYVIEGNFGADEFVPLEAIKGGWKVDESGTLTGEYWKNPRFKPVPASED
jgi:hypothetical protein